MKTCKKFTLKDIEFILQQLEAEIDAEKEKLEIVRKKFEKVETKHNVEFLAIQESLNRLRQLI